MLATYTGVGWRSPIATAAIPRTAEDYSAPHTTKWPQWPGKLAAMKILSSLHSALYRVSNGQAGRTLRGGSVLLLTTTGRKTKKTRTWPLSYISAGDGVVVVASAAGAARHPGWYLNLKADPKVSVQVGRRRRAMVARPAEGRQRTQLWERLVEQYPVLARYQRMARREFPVVVLQPEPAAAGMSRVATRL